MNVAELSRFIGRPAHYSPDRELHFAVVVHDVRTRYGNVDYLIAPRDGSGERWVAESRVTFGD